jgi:hypothetical protein
MKSQTIAWITFLMLAASAFPLKSALAEGSKAECAPAQGFVEVPPPPIDRSDEMVSRTETILVDRPLGTVLTVVNRPLKDALHPTGSLPGVTGTYPLTRGDFGGPGSRRLVCLSDGSSTEERVLTRERGENSYRFRYQVWNYTSRAAGAIGYAVGEFVFTRPTPDSTKIVWTYSFALRRDRFPGYLGRLGDFLFRISFLDRDWAEVMRNVLSGYRTAAGNETVSRRELTFTGEAT